MNDAPQAESECVIGLVAGAARSFRKLLDNACPLPDAHRGRLTHPMHKGILSAALAYVIWGLFPLYFKLLSDIAPLEVLVHRVLWSLLFLLGVLAVRRQWDWLKQARSQPRAYFRLLGVSAISATLLSANWLTYIWSVTNGHVIEASLGWGLLTLSEGSRDS